MEGMEYAEANQYLSYFNRTVLCHLRASPDLYVLEEDDMGGHVKAVLDDNPEGSQGDWLDVRFAFRRLADRRVCVAAFTPDISKMSERQLLIWRGHRLAEPLFATADPAFQRWVKRYLEGSWEVEDGPLPSIRQFLAKIRALTKQTLGTPLWRSERHELINYPVAENSDAYIKATLELYRVLIDTLDPTTIAAIAARQGITLSDPAKSMNSLKEILPEHLRPVVHLPLKRLADARNKNHGVPSRKAYAYPAFDTFQGDLTAMLDGLVALTEWFQEILEADADACVLREEIMAGLPEIIGPPRPEFKLHDLQEAEGKTIASVEFGEWGHHPDRHGAEMMILHFTDGSSLVIEVGSNASNVSGQYDGLKPSDFDTDLRPVWLPSTKAVTVFPVDDTDLSNT